MKLGGSVITDKEKEFSIRRSAIRRLARELKGKEKIILIHGGGSFGHPLAKRYDLTGGLKSPGQLRGFVEVRRAMERLNLCVLEELVKEGIPAVPIPPSSCCLLEGGEVRVMELRPVKRMLELGLMPVLYGDAVIDLKQGVNILSGDRLAVQLALQLGASRVLFGVDVDGVFTDDPKRNPKAELIKLITPREWEKMKASFTPSGWDVTGGMLGKVMELLKLAERGIEAQIVNASKRGVLERALEGDRSLGTLIRGE
ncbi:MAG: isopentenyl phosphate kinase [Candidatus Hadarchaeales archaeon]